MEDLIKRSDAIKALNREKSDWNCDYNVPIDNCIKRLNKVKPADRPQEQTMKDTYRFRRVEIRREVRDACHSLITDQCIAEDVYMSIMMPLEDFLSDHEVEGVDDDG